MRRVRQTSSKVWEYINRSSMKKIIGFSFLIAIIGIFLLHAAFASPTEKPLQLLWLNNNGESHLVLEPANNTSQLIALRIDFLSGTENTYAPGEIEIRIPRWIFQLREENFFPTIEHRYSHQIPTAPAGDISNMGFLYHGVIDGYIILRNHREFLGTERYTADISFTYIPSFVISGGFKHEITGNVRFNEEVSLSSNVITAEIISRIVPRDPLKEIVVVHQSWSNSWGSRPVNYLNYFFVEYRIFIGNTSGTTQPFIAQITETPGTYNGSFDGVPGEIVAWTNPATSWMNSTAWNRGNTAEFNNSNVSIWNQERVSIGAAENRWSRVVVKYPRTGNPDQRVTNSFEVTFTGLDGKILNQEVSAYAIFNVTEYVYAGDLFNITKSMGTRIQHAIHDIERERRITTTATLPVTSRGFSLTNNGSNPFTTQVIDDYVYLQVGTVNHQLNPDDYRFTRISITNLVEHRPLRSAYGGVIGSERIPNLERSPIRIYGRYEQSSTWNYLGSIPVSTGNNLVTPSAINNQLTGGHFSNVKAIHMNGTYSVSFTLSVDIQLIPTVRVQNLIRNTTGTVRLHNFGNLQVFQHGYERVPENRVNTTSNTTTTGIWGLVNTRDLNHYGTRLQRATNNIVLDRVTFESQVGKDITRMVRDHENSREIITYRLVGGQRAQDVYGQQLISGTVLREIIEARNIDIREGVFFDLLPRGTILLEDTIVARDTRNILPPELVNVRTHPNWRGSGQTLLEVQVQAAPGTNTGFFHTAQFPGTGFRLYFDVSYPWANINDYGRNVRNIAAFQSRSGAILGSANWHRQDDGNWANFTVAERPLMANLARDASGVELPLGQRNTLYMQRNVTVDNLGTTNIGFTKQVRAQGDQNYSFRTVVNPNQLYTYRLRFQNADNNNVSNLIMFDVLEGAHEGNPHWRGILESVDVGQPIMRGAAPVAYFSTLSGIDPVNNIAHSDLMSDIWTRDKPVDRSTITAVAIDLRRNSTGGEFLIEPLQTTVITLHMRAPSEPFSTRAYNRAAYIATINPIAGGETVERQIVETPRTEIRTPPPPHEVHIRKTGVALGSVPAVDNLEGATLKVLNSSNEVVYGPFITGISPRTIPGLIYGNTYTVREVRAPDRYRISADTTFTVGGDNNPQIIVINNHPNVTQVRKVNADNNEALSGAELILWRTDVEPRQEVRRWTSGTNGEMFHGLLPGTYEIEEYRAPAGFVSTSTTRTFTVTNEDTLALRDIVIHNTQNQLSIIKYNTHTQAPLSGARMQIENSAGERWGDEFTSTLLPTIFNQIPAGTWYLRELSPPPGFTLSTTRQPFTVEAGQDNIVVYLGNTRNLVSVEKVSSVTNNPVPGANLRLETANGTLVREWVSGTTPERIYQLPTGTYYLVELSPPVGYILNSNRQQIIITEETGTLNVTKSNNPINVRIRKVDIATNEALVGARYEVINAAYEVVYAFYSTLEPIFIPGLRYGGVYRIREVRAPDGFLLNPELIPFTVSSGNFNTIIDVGNHENVIHIEKREASNNNHLPGALLRLTNETTGELVREWTSGTTGEMFQGLLPGEYLIEEISAPEGFVSSGTTVNFTVSTTDTAPRVITVYNSRYQLTIIKYDEDHPNRQLLPGAVMRVEDYDGNIIIEDFTTSSTPSEFNELPSGVFYLVEISPPPGFTLSNQRIQFEVEDGIENIIVSLGNSRNRLLVTKVNEETEEMLPGAKLRLTTENGTLIREWTSSYYAEEFTMLPVGVYRLYELEAPYGFIHNTDRREIEITEETVVLEIIKTNTPKPEDYVPERPSIPDTLANIPTSVYIIGGLFVITGVSIIGYLMKKKKELEVI